MPTVKEYTQLLLQVEGLQNYLLMKTDGRILSHNVADPDALSSLLALSNLGVKKIQDSLGLQHFNHLLLKRQNQENLLLLKLGSILLGVQQKPNTACSELLSDLARVQEQVSTQK